MTRQEQVPPAVVSTRRVSIGAALDPRSNSINALRLGLAVLVIVSHSFPLGGYGDAPGAGGSGGSGLGHSDLGDWAVGGFFVTSGYLITASRLRSRSLGDYLWRRFLRIYPAFLVSLLVVGLAIAPLASLLLDAGPWSAAGGARFVLGNLALYIREYGIDGMLGSVPYPGAWNGSLWSLFFEFVSYLVIGVLISVVPRRWVAPLVVVGFAGLTLVAGVLATDLVPFPAALNQTVTLVAYFLAGAILHLFRDRIPLTLPLALLAVVLFALVVASGLYRVLAGLPLAYLMLALGARLPLRRLGATHDVSYGMYIYAFPVQQLLALALVDADVPLGAYVLLSIAATLPFAWASWLLIERPAMRLKRLTARAPVDDEGHVV
ncbi:peptidoglycan/LPS O-acetylase OafA/YrhL [Rathayibacter sp. PhB93]|uniref:acyltransferase family protein n=1 Tax=unclassified Rathayibacter TaxID=2609250 RepID=UPI000F48C546|nr:MULTISPECIES: acyltransferase [unclassified Rathayibacter]ROQ15540.1 peptidoglycan/LPS O-acetylase OafA/YrhL [Rathayibacter sp. PhB93]TDQ15478.1 peptidoglycan/LPS O-acetylase OafA/YrhL [Rathayibacter sp. PhB1]